MDGTKEIHRVHFDVNKSDDQKDNDITVQLRNGKFDVHLGFLQLNHKYRINFTIPESLCKCSTESQVILEDFTHINPNLQVIEATCSKYEVNFQLELYAHKEKLMIEEFSFRLNGESTVHNVKLNARVLGKGKGTPLLKNEIHVIQVPEDSDSSSD